MTRIVLLVGGAALLAVLIRQLGVSDIVDALARVGWFFVVVLLLGGLHHATRALALHECVLRPGVIRYRDALAIRLSGEAIQSLTLTGPVLAEPTKAWLLETRGLTLTEGFAATIAEYLLYTFVTAAMSIAGLAYILSSVELPATAAAIAIGIICACGVFLAVSTVAIARRFYLIGTIIAWLARVGVLRGRLTPDMAWINRMEDLLLTVLRDSPARCLTIATLEAAAQGVLVLELLWLLRALDVTVPGVVAFAIEASIKFFEFAFLFVPLQLGVAEGSYAEIFDVMRLPLAAGFAVAFVRRLRGLTIASLGLALLALATRHRRRVA
jgi:hypothetical protein